MPALLATLVRFRAGKNIGMTELRDLRGHLWGQEVSNILSDWYTLGPLPIEGVQPEFPP